MIVSTKTLTNNLYMLREIWRASSSRVIFSILQRILKKFATAFLIQIYLFKYVVDSVEQGRAFSEVIGMISAIMAVVAACFVFVEWYNNLCVPNTDEKINYYFNRKLYMKAQEVDLSCYDDPAFYNSFTRAVTDSVKQAHEVLDSITDGSSSIGFHCTHLDLYHAGSFSGSDLIDTLSFTYPNNRCTSP